LLAETKFPQKPLAVEIAKAKSHEKPQYFIGENRVFGFSLLFARGKKGFL